MRDFRRKDKKKNEGIFLPMPSFFSEKVRSGDRTAHQPPQKTHILLYDKAATMPRPFSQAKSPSDDGLFACEIVYTRRERRGYIKWVMLLS